MNEAEPFEKPSRVSRRPDRQRFTPASPPAAVPREALGRPVTAEAMSAAVAGKANARTKLEAILRLFVGILTGPVSSSWALPVALREVVDPSPAVTALEEKPTCRRGPVRRRVLSQRLNHREPVWHR
jgi:hypothetical protein